MGNVQIINWVDTHGILCLIIFIVTSTCIGYLPAPTKDSTKFYQWFFAVSNSLIGQLARAFKSKIENSPNWIDAVAKATNGSVVIDSTKNPLFLK
jgi:hypothetical protein